jgi:hypothetical protein
MTTEAQVRIVEVEEELRQWLKDVGITETEGEKLLLRLLISLQSENVTKHEVENNDN